MLEETKKTKKCELKCVGYESGEGEDFAVIQTII